MIYPPTTPMALRLEAVLKEILDEHAEEAVKLNQTEPELQAQALTYHANALNWYRVITMLNAIVPGWEGENTPSAHSALRILDEAIHLYRDAELKRKVNEAESN